MSIITLTTDFGQQDWFVGTLKGVILGICRRAVVVDLCHGLEPGDLRAGAFALAAGYRWFPRGTVHAAIVDPGVGGPRPALAVETTNYFFIGPDNGVLSWALAREQVKSIRRVENKQLFLKPVSHTFHARDIFAPVAAHLSKGAPFESVGPSARDFQRLPCPAPKTTRGRIRGEVLYLDRFGNAITNIENASARFESIVLIKGRRRCLLERFYDAVPPGRLVCVPGSSGFLEIAVNGGSAARLFQLRIGDPVEVGPGRRHPDVS